MISYGECITTLGDSLRKISIQEFADKIIRPDSNIANIIRQLRIVHGLDLRQYNNLKKRLPYVVCSIFNPQIRKTENFAYTEYFVLDIDNIAEKGMSLDSIKTMLASDNRTMLCFTSPSKDGLKLFFKLSNRCYDAGMFSLFYKIFAKQFSLKYNLQQVIDTKTSDTTRACFLSMDSDAYFNPSAEPVVMDDYLKDDDVIDFFRKKHELETDAKKQADNDHTENAKKKKTDDVGNDIISNIKQILSPETEKKKCRQPVFVPERLNDIMEGLCLHIESTGTTITEVVDIQYGQKIRTMAGTKSAETNVFYGKRGFSVVVSPRSGTDSELNTLIAELIRNYLEEI